MQKPEKAKAVRLQDDDGKIHLTMRRPSSFAGGMTWVAFCGRPASQAFLAGLPHVHAAPKRCPTCYSMVDPYGYPKLAEAVPADVAIPVDRDALQEAALAGVDNVREAWDAMKRIRAALEKRGRVKTPRRPDFAAEAAAIVEAIRRL